MEIPWEVHLENQYGMTFFSIRQGLDGDTLGSPSDT